MCLTYLIQQIYFKCTKSKVVIHKFYNRYNFNCSQIQSNTVTYNMIVKDITENKHRLKFLALKNTV